MQLKWTEQPFLTHYPQKKTLVDIYETKIRALAELKQSLPHQAFTCELTVHPKYPTHRTATGL